MNEVIAIPEGLETIHVGEMLSLPWFRSETHESLPSQGVQALNTIARIVDDLVAATVTKRTHADFVATRDVVFPNYFRATRAVADIARIVVPRHSMEVIAAASFSSMEADFRDQGLLAFGRAVQDQAIFTVWTLRKISDLCQRIDDAKLEAHLAESDREMFSGFAFHAIRARFHLDCLQKSMSTGKPLHPEILDAVLDGLRSAVNAYSWARRAFDLRMPRDESENLAVVWDDEDEQLMREANSEMLPEPA